MPPESPWPFVAALSIGLVFTFVLVDHFAFAALFGLPLVGSLIGWHTQKPWRHEEL